MREEEDARRWRTEGMAAQHGPTVPIATILTQPTPTRSQSQTAAVILAYSNASITHQEQSRISSK